MNNKKIILSLKIKLKNNLYFDVPQERAMATVMPMLRPESQGVQFTARAALRTRESIGSRLGGSKNGRSASVGKFYKETL